MYIYYSTLIEIILEFHRKIIDSYIENKKYNKGNFKDRSRYC